MAKPVLTASERREERTHAEGSSLLLTAPVSENRGNLQECLSKALVVDEPMDTLVALWLSGARFTNRDSNSAFDFLEQALAD